jgi:serine/threonine-protein kinase
MSSVAVETSSPTPFSSIAFDPLRGTGYRALGRLGGGSTSEVYAAIAPDGTRCAVKLLREVFLDTPDALHRFEQEADALAMVDHPSLVRVLDVGTTVDGRPYFVMPLVEGETVKCRLSRVGPFDPGDACAILGEVLEALDVAHRAAVVHRDVKPGNVLLPADRRRRAVLLDFGIAKLLGAPSTHTTDAHVVGTPRYLAPEQILGGVVDARTDVYAAGLTLFEMIAGRGPFDAASPMQLMRAHLEDPGRRLRSLATVSHAVDHAVARATAKSPGRRWPSARAFAAVLAHVAPPFAGSALRSESAS